MGSGPGAWATRVAVWCCGVLSLATPWAASLPYLDRKRARDEALEMLRHSYDSYMRVAFPWDELRPLSCEARRWDRRERGTLDDSLGGVSLTLVDALSTLAVVRDSRRFTHGVRSVVESLSFDRDVAVSVFETTIRVLGGLLSAHLLILEVPGLYHASPETPPYAGELLDLAVDLGDRLLRAFATPTGIPVHKVHLTRGIEPKELRTTCPAAAGTLLVEMGVLSRLTGDSRYQDAAHRAVREIWQRRSKLDLVGSSINVDDGSWQSQQSSIGAGIDSFFEYLFKAGVVLDDGDLVDMFHLAFSAVDRHARWKKHHVEVCMVSGRPKTHRVSALQAFWPALQLQAGNLSAAEATYQSLLDIWRKFRALPEMYDVRARDTLSFSRDSPLRPELLESTYHLYGATRKDKYLRSAFDMLYALQNISRVDCGFASIADVHTHRLDDRMDSYFISETLKYLFLIFDESLDPQDRKSLLCPGVGNATHNTVAAGPTPVDDSASAAAASVNGSTVETAGCLPKSGFIFTTEGHPILLSRIHRPAGLDTQGGESLDPESSLLSHQGALRVIVGAN